LPVALPALTDYGLVGMVIVVCWVAIRHLRSSSR